MPRGLDAVVPRALGFARPTRAGEAHQRAELVDERRGCGEKHRGDGAMGEEGRGIEKGRKRIIEDSCGEAAGRSGDPSECRKRRDQP